VLLNAGAANAAPSNKNTEVIHATCDGDAITISVVNHSNENANLVSAGPLIGGGAVKVVPIVAYEPGTTNVIFSAETHFGAPANAECTGTITEGGDTFDFVIQAHIAGR
jgi:hypothetical protein